MAKKKAKRAADIVPVDAIKHKDSRTNIPTRELAAFAGDEERAPKAVLYPRDPSLDPQLVWKGKDEQDQKPLEVPAVPIYIQEKIHPQALIEDIRARAAAGKQRQLDLFADFNGIDEFEKKVDFYHHNQHWSNRLILGDSLLVMTSLAEKERLKGQVQMIYIDPPYGIKFGSNWQVSTRKREVKDAKAEDVTRQPEQIKAFRDTWQLGIHSYLTYLRDRLTVARDLLTESGSIFVQIGDENVHLVRCLMDEVFGSENFSSLISYTKTTTTTGALLPGTADFILWYAKNKDRAKYKQIYGDKIAGGVGASGYSQIEEKNSCRRSMTPEEKENPSLVVIGCKIYSLDNLTSPRVREARTGYYPVEIDGRTFYPLKGEWKTHHLGYHLVGNLTKTHPQGREAANALQLRRQGWVGVQLFWPFRAVQAERGRAHNDQGNSGVHTGNFHAIDPIPRRTRWQQSAGFRADYFQVIQHDGRRRLWHAIDGGLPFVANPLIRSLHGGANEGAGVDRMDANRCLGHPRLQQTCFDGKGGHTGQEVATGGRRIDQRSVQSNLGKQVIDICIGSA